MRYFHKIIIYLISFVSFFVLFLTLHGSNVLKLIRSPIKTTSVENGDGIQTLQVWGRRPTTLKAVTPVSSNRFQQDVYNIWCIFTKVNSNAPLKFKFKTFVRSLLKYSNARLRLNLISDNSSLPIAQDVLQTVTNLTGKTLDLVYYDVRICAKEAEDIVLAMQPYFSSQPGTYYSDVLFFLSLGLHRIAKNQQKAALFDADIKLVTDVTEIFLEFNRFGPEALFGLAAEQSPVYRHVLYNYRLHQPDSRFGSPSVRGGFPGVNSGVLLLDLDRMRKAEKYHLLLLPEAVANLTRKYKFKGHLGDQDFYTLLSMDDPSLIHLLPCGWNRQLCTWWRDHGYREIFEEFHHCDAPVKAYHGNCNTRIPDT